MSEAYSNSGDNIQFKNVLAVDNDPIMLKFISRILEKAGLNVVTAKDGVTAIDIIESYTPDLFFIDLVMPNIDGRELCRIIRSKEKFKTSPIVIISAIAAEESIDTAEIGANVCIAKVAYSEMEKTINKLLIDPQLIWNPILGNRVLGIDDLSPRNITHELLTVNRHYRFMLDSISSGIIEFDQNRRVIYANPAALRIFSMQPEVILGSHVDQLFKAEAGEKLFSLIHSSQPEGVLLNHHVKISVGKCILDACVAPSDHDQDTHVIIMEDITIRETTQEKLIEANNKLEILARVDSLTEVFNRRHFDETLHHEWGRMKREKGGLSLILCDVDYFKNYNDTYGHLEGDKCLRKIAKAIYSKIRRPSDIVARYGGDEFVVLLPNTMLEGAQHLAEQIRNFVCQLQIRHEKSPIENHVTVTIGAGSGFPDDTFPEDKIIWLADKALYEAKTKGRNCIVGKTLQLVHKFSN